MSVIMVYDVGVDRVSKVLSIARKYLTWIQNSVLEGEITEADFVRLKSEVLRVINKEEDSVVFYILRTTAYMRKEHLGVVKGERSIVL